MANGCSPLRRLCVDILYITQEVMTRDRFLRLVQVLPHVELLSLECRCGCPDRSFETLLIPAPRWRYSYYLKLGCIYLWNRSRKPLHSWLLEQCIWNQCGSIILIIVSDRISCRVLQRDGEECFLESGTCLAMRMCTAPNSSWKTLWAKSRMVKVIVGTLMTTFESSVGRNQVM